jgi:hypothetical protein
VTRGTRQERDERREERRGKKKERRKEAGNEDRRGGDPGGENAAQATSALFDSATWSLVRPKRRSRAR